MISAVIIRQPAAGFKPHSENPEQGHQKELQIDINKLLNNNKMNRRREILASPF